MAGRRVNDDLESYFNRGIDLVNRRIFVGEITEESADRIIKAMWLLETESTTKPCELFISSVGGSVYDALGIYDVMRRLACPVHTFAFGKCMRAAPVLLSVGETGHRWCTENTSFMVHEVSDELAGRNGDLQANVQQIALVDENWNRLFTKHTAKPYSFWRSKSKGPDFYFTAEQAIEWGIVDAIWAEKN